MVEPIAQSLRLTMDSLLWFSITISDGVDEISLFSFSINCMSGGHVISEQVILFFQDFQLGMESFMHLDIFSLCTMARA